MDASQPQSQPQEPSIGNAQDASQSSLLARRHKSRPSRRTRSESASSVDPAHPEVISSLITSLSTISVPVQNHFDGLPPSDESHPDHPTPLHLNSAVHGTSSDPDSANDHGFGVTYGASKSPDESAESPFLHPDDAAAAPIVRMARAPTSPKSSKSKSFSAEQSPARPASRASYASSQAVCDGDAPFGTITAEPGPRISTAASIASSSSGGRRSLRNSMGLFKKSSHEFTTDKQRLNDHLRKRSSYNDGLRHSNAPRTRTSLRSMRSMADLAEEGRSNTNNIFTMESQSEMNAPRESSSQDCQSRTTTADGQVNSPIGTVNGRAIPTRESSLRHSQSSHSRKHRSGRHSRYSSMGSNNDLETGSRGNSSEVERITQRIKELKEQRQRIKNEREPGPDSPRSTRSAPSKQTRSSHARSEIIDWERLLQEHTNEPSGATKDSDVISEESAPAPAVMTGKSRAQIRPNAPHAATTKTTDSTTKPEQPGRGKPRQSFEHTSSKRHKRHPSGATNQSHPPTNDGRPSSADSVDEEVFAYLSSPKLTQKVTHPTTGRTIAFSEVGDPKGRVVLCCLGMGLTRYLMAFYDELARTLHLRLVTLDRPGVGESGPYLGDELGTPLTWPDDVAIVCNHLRVTKFSILAHSAGAIYALATALRIPQHIRGCIHLLAPWVPPSQLSSIGAQKAPAPSNAVPYSQRILRTLPPSILKVANSSFLTATSASVTSNLPKSPRRNKRKASGATNKHGGSQNPESEARQKGDTSKSSEAMNTSTAVPNDSAAEIDDVRRRGQATTSQGRERQLDYDMRLTYKTWELATTKANPAIDLIVCLERRQEIGFRYVDITRPVVIHHGSRDARVPVDTVRWLGKMMRRCEVRILEGEGHGLMASAAVMGSVLMEMAREWDDWTKIIQGRRKGTVNHPAHSGIMVQSS